MIRFLACLTLALAAAPTWAQQNVGCDGPVPLKAGRSGPCTKLAGAITELLNEPAVARAHWGVAITSMDGAPIYSFNERQLFQPASNAKLFTTSAAIALLGPEITFETKILARGTLSNGTLTGDLALVGAGDANLSGREIPYVEPELRPKTPPPPIDPLRYLEEMADQIAKTGLKTINGDVVGDDTLFPWEPYAADWSIDDTVWGYGAPVSALTINDNQIKMTITPGTAVGSHATVTVDPVVPYYTVDVSGLSTGAVKSGTHIQIERALGSKAVRVYGTIALDARPDEEEVAIHDPAEYAATALKQMLEVRGIVVTGVARAEHREPMDAEGFMTRLKEPGSENSVVEHDMTSAACPAASSSVVAGETILASHRSATLLEDVTVANKTSQNLHAELWLHHLGQRACGDGSTVAGARMVRAFLLQAGLDKDDFVFFDGSGLSGHDLVTPRATVRLLQYAAGQPWFAAWKATLPVGGVDGTLEGRFTKAPLKGRVWAKTGTLGEARALSGYVECVSGRTVIFSIMVGNHAPQNNSDRDVMDKIVAAIAAAN